MTAVEETNTRDTATPPTMHGALANMDEEHSYWLDSVEGEVPSDIHGTFIRNGPGRQRIGDTPYGHWFDGCGMLSLFSIAEGKVHFANKYVRTPKYLKETASQSIKYRGFGTQIPGGVLKNVGRMPGNPANTNSVYHGGKLLALYEGGRPFEVDPTTLETVGEYTYDGELKKSNVFSAHGHFHGPTGDWVNFGTGSSGMGLKGPKLCFNIFRINPAGKMIAKGQLPVDYFPFAHDFALSSKYAIFFINSITMGPIGQVMLGARSIAEGVDFDENQPMQIALVDLDTMQEVRRIETEPGAIVHFGNAYEEGDEVVVDAMWADQFEANEALSDIFNAEALKGGEWRRYRINAATGALSFEVLSDVNSEFPSFDQRQACRPHELTFAAASVENGSDSFFNGFHRANSNGDIQLHTLEPGFYGSEPLYAPSTESEREEDGYILEVVYDGFAHRSSLVIFRAADISEPIASLPLRHHLPHQFHGFWNNEVLLKAALAG
ncbi:MAG: carotenoid oxygenase family protein [Acidimicrobiales bacterium]|jgi:all-trans-8'-apo-beta-carotenal 15,15'-oxygenase|nr:carotenoid oxygenase family protein [Acidimicrobiales bacterium]